jgi:hypothetical protein
METVKAKQVGRCKTPKNSMYVEASMISPLKLVLKVCSDCDGRWAGLELRWTFKLNH